MFKHLLSYIVSFTVLPFQVLLVNLLISPFNLDNHFDSFKQVFAVVSQLFVLNRTLSFREFRQTKDSPDGHRNTVWFHPLCMSPNSGFAAAADDYSYHNGIPVSDFPSFYGFGFRRSHNYKGILLTICYFSTPPHASKTHSAYICSAKYFLISSIP